MTTASASKKATPRNASQDEAAVTDVKVTEVPITETATETTEAPANRIPDSLKDQTILIGFMQQLLQIFDELSTYNSKVLAERNSEWNATKVLAEARKLVSSEDPEKVNQEVKTALDKMESLVTELSKARADVVSITSGILGINLSAVADRDHEYEVKLKEKRAMAVTIGKTLKQIAEMTTDPTAGEAVGKFLEDYKLPGVGRDQAHSFTATGASTPKYRVTVEVKKGDETLLTEDGFTKTAALLSKPVFGYDRGKSLKSDDLRAAWEKSGNSPEKTVVNPVEFEDNGLTFIITKK